MSSKLILTLAVLLLAHHTSAALRRSPRVYNALITTDQNLTPSRSFPVIQPHIEYPAYVPPWLGSHYNPYSTHNYYNPGAYLGYQPQHHQPFGYPLDAAVVHQQQFAFADQLDAAARAANNQHRRNQNKHNDDASDGGARSTKSDENETKPDTEANSPVTGKSAGNDKNPEAQDPKPSTGQQNPANIPLNEFGLPASLVPISSVYNGWNYHGQGPVNLSPYPYHSYPLIYDQINPYQPHEFLPPYGFYSPELYPQGGGGGFAGGAHHNNGGAHDSGASDHGDGTNAGRKSGGGTGNSDSVESAQNESGQNNPGGKQDSSQQDSSQHDSSQQGAGQDQAQQSEGAVQQNQNNQQPDQVGQQDQQSAVAGDSQTNESQQNAQRSQSDQSAPAANNDAKSGAGSQSSSGQLKQGRSISMAQIRNYVPMNREIRDVPPPPLPRGAHVVEGNNTN